MHLELRTESEGHTSEHDCWVVRTEDTAELEIDGERYEAQVERAHDGTLHVHIGEQTFKVEITGDETARVDGHAVSFTIDRFEPGGAPGEHETLVQGEGVVRPPMPGKLTQVHVAEGDTVEKGDALAVLEAMKMQSTIEAPRAGTVLRVHVAAGAAVEGREVLFEIGDESA